MLLNKVRRSVYVFGVSQLAMYERLKQCGIVDTGV